MTILLDDSDIAVLNSARTILKRVGTAAMNASFDAERPYDGAGLGRLAHAADDSSDAIFRAMCQANTYAGVPMSKAQLHNAPDWDETLA
jgi:hypothetical protein